MRRVIFAALCAAVLMATPASAATNGQLVTVSAGSALVTLNADGTGVHRILQAPVSSVLTSPVWSPDGNRIAFVLDGRIKALVLASGALTDLAAGSDPGWTPDGDVAFRRGQDLLAVPAAGGAERSLGRLPDTATQDLAWSPDGWIVRRTGPGDLYLDTLDGSAEDSIGSDATGAPDWSPDGELVVFPARDLGPVHLAVNSLEGDTLRLSASGYNPAWSPDGETIAFLGTSGLRLVDAETLADTGVPTPAASYSYLDWQPCVTGVTSSCVSVTPVSTPQVTCSATPLSVRSGQSGGTRIACSSGFVRTYEIAGAPAHGTASVVNSRIVTYRAADGYTGADSFTVKVTGSNFAETVTVNVTVTPTLQALAAPKLNVSGQPRLDRRGRVTLRGTCTNTCLAELRVIVRLNTGRVLKGRVVKALSLAGQTLKLHLRRAKLPRHRRIVSARIAGTLTGINGQKRNFTLSLIP